MEAHHGFVQNCRISIVDTGNGDTKVLHEANDLAKDQCCCSLQPPILDVFMAAIKK